MQYFLFVYCGDTYEIAYNETTGEVLSVVLYQGNLNVRGVPLLYKDLSDRLKSRIQDQIFYERHTE